MTKDLWGYGVPGPGERTAADRYAISHQDVYDGFYDEDFDPEDPAEPHDGPWYHYSPHSLPVGTHLTPGYESPWGDNYYEKDGTEHRRNYLWLSPSLIEAVGWAGMTPRRGQDGPGHIYRVEPHSDVLPWNGSGSDGWVADGAHIAEEIPYPWKGPHTAHRTANQPIKLYRGMRVNLPPELVAEMREKINAPRSLEEAGRELELGPKILDHLSSQPWSMAVRGGHETRIGLGGNWHPDPKKAHEAAYGYYDAAQQGTPWGDGTRAEFPLLMTAEVDQPGEADPRTDHLAGEVHYPQGHPMNITSLVMQPEIGPDGQVCRRLPGGSSVELLHNPRYERHGIHPGGPRQYTASRTAMPHAKIYRGLEIEPGQDVWDSIHGSEKNPGGVGPHWSTSRSVAEDFAGPHGVVLEADSGDEDWSIVQAKVPAKHVWTNNDLHEWGYQGPNVSGQIVRESAHLASFVDYNGQTTHLTGEDMEGLQWDWGKGRWVPRPSGEDRLVPAREERNFNYEGRWPGWEHNASRLAMPTTSRRQLES